MRLDDRYGTVKIREVMATEEFQARLALTKAKYRAREIEARQR